MPPTGPLRQKIIASFDEMSPQLKQAARYLIEHPQEVALISMRELARKAGVQPATMSRLAQYIGATGYEDLRAEHAMAIRKTGFAARESGRIDHGPEELGHEMLSSLSAQIAELAQPNRLAGLARAAHVLKSASKVYVLGARSCLSVAWQFHYVMSLMADKTVHLDGPGGTGADPLMRATADDALMVVSFNPYARHSVDVAGLARDAGIKVLAITDSEVSPLVPLADEVILCPSESRTFFHSLTPAFAISEVLCGMLASLDRPGAIKALDGADQQLDALGTYTVAIPRRTLP